jgi:predicted metal-dependent hydrolase
LSKEDLDKFYKQKAQEIILPLIKEYSNKMQLFPTDVKFRRNKTRWGSCSYKNIINFNIYLIKKDIEFIKYVVVHELAHIKYKNHQKDFWNLVKKYNKYFKTN